MKIVTRLVLILKGVFLVLILTGCTNDVRLAEIEATQAVEELRAQVAIEEARTAAQVAQAEAFEAQAKAMQEQAAAYERVTKYQELTNLLAMWTVIGVAALMVGFFGVIMYRAVTQPRVVVHRLEQRRRPQVIVNQPTTGIVRKGREGRLIRNRKS